LCIADNRLLLSNSVIFKKFLRVTRNFELLIISRSELLAYQVGGALLGMGISKANDHAGFENYGSVTGAFVEKTISEWKRWLFFFLK